MARDVVISCFATRRSAQPVDALAQSPAVISVDGLGSDQYKASFDTERKPREPWGSQPFAREAERYRDADGSILRKLIQSKARGVTTRRIELVSFSAGTTFIGKVLASPIDAANVDAVIVLDGLHLPKLWSGEFEPRALRTWVDFASRAAGIGQPVQNASAGGAGFLVPLMVISHTNIKQDAAKEKLVGNTTDSAEAVTHAVWQRFQRDGRSSRASFEPYDGAALCATAPPPPAVTLGPPGPPPSKTWTRPACPDPWRLGNLWEIDYGGRSGADHIYQAWYAQKAIWQQWLVPRWNRARSQGLVGLGAPPAAGLGDFVEWWGNLVPEGVYPASVPYWQMGLGALVGGALGYKLVRAV
jgi:hypothetical protein